MTPISDEDIEMHAWPGSRYGGQQVGAGSYGVLAIHKPTGIAAAVTDERSQLRNRKAAIAKLRQLVELQAATIEWHNRPFSQQPYEGDADVYSERDLVALAAHSRLVSAILAIEGGQ